MVDLTADDGSEVLDLYNAIDFFGVENDSLFIYNSYGSTGVVATYGGDDLIRLNDFSTGFGGPASGGTGDDTIVGGGGTDVINDGDGDDEVNGRGGDDEIFADRGDDIYKGGTGADIIHFSVVGANGPGQGVANTEGVTCDLGDTGVQELGIFGSDVIRGFENIFGGGGNDTLFAFDGSDTMTGGLGADAIILHEPGGPARDRVRFLTIDDSGLDEGTRDSVNDFDAGGESTADRIDLRAIDAKPLTQNNENFQFVSAFTTAAGEVKVTVMGSDTLVSVDTDSDAAAEMTILLAGVTGITAGDFIL